MKQITIQQEILLVTTTEFCRRELYAKDDCTGKKQSCQEQLEEACWNGLLENLLPEILQKPASGNRLYLWHIRSGQSFLQIEMSQLPALVEKRFSIDTSFFLSTVNWS